MVPPRRRQPQPPARRTKVAGRPSPRPRTESEQEQQEAEPPATPSPKPRSDRTAADQQAGQVPPAADEASPEEADAASTGAGDTAKTGAGEAGETGAATETPAEHESEHDSEAAEDDWDTEHAGSGEIAEATELAAGADDETAGFGKADSSGKPSPGESSSGEPTGRRPVGRTRRARESISYPPQSDVTVSNTAKQEPDGADQATKRSPMRLPVILAIVAVLLAGFAIFAGLRASSINGQAGDNTALVDSKATNQVKQQATNALNTMFSFDYKNPDKTKKDAAPLMVGKVSDQYDKLMKVLRDNGAKNKLSLNSAVLSLGVQRIEGSRARVLALMSQTYSKGDGKSAQQVPTIGMVRADLQQQGKNWKVSGLKMLSG